jgi:hypothetical protein
LALNADNTIWRGVAADVFRDDLGKLPERLDKLHDSYHEASEALRIYGVSLRQLQSDADVELQKAIAADEEAAAAAREMLASPAAAPPLIGPPAADPTEAARAALTDARNAIERIRQDREIAEGKAVDKLDHAGDIGIHNKSRWDRITGTVSDAISAVDNFVHKSLRSIGDLADTFSKILTVVGIVLVLAAAVAASVALMAGTGGLGTPVVAALWSASGSVFTAAAVSTAVSVTAKSTSKRIYNDKDLSWGALAIDGGMAAVGVVGGPMKALKGGSNVFKGTRLFRAGSGAMSALTSSSGRIGTFALRASQISSEAWTGARAFSASAGNVWRAGVGTEAAPTLAGMMFKAGDEARGLWADEVGSPLRFIPGIGLGSDAGTLTHVPVGRAS